MPNKQPTKLENMHLDEVSLVNKGANKKKRFPIYKQEQDPMMEDIIKSVMETAVDEEKSLDEIIEKSDFNEKTTSALKAALRVISGFRDTLPENTIEILAKASGMGSKKPMMDDKEEEDEEEDSMSKELPEDVKKALDSLKAENERITKQLELQKESKDLAEWRNKVEKDLAFYPGESFDEMAVSLHNISKVDAELANKQFAQMKKASDALKGSDQFSENGANIVNKSNNTDAWGQIEKLADGVIEKSSDLNMSREDAVCKVLESRRGRELYAQYLNEHPQQSR